MHLHQGCVRWSPVLSGVGVEEGDAGGESLGRRQETLRPAGCPEGGWHQGVHADFQHLSWSPLTRGGRGGISPYLAAERPGPGGLGPSGAGSPSGRRWKQLERERREAGRELGAASPAPRACGTPLLLSAWSREHPLLGEALQLGLAQEHLTGPFRQSLRSTVFGPLVTNGNPKRGSHAPKATQLDRGPLASLF